MTKQRKGQNKSQSPERLFSHLNSPKPKDRLFAERVCSMPGLFLKDKGIWGRVTALGDPLETGMGQSGLYSHKDQGAISVQKEKRNLFCFLKARDCLISSPHQCVPAPCCSIPGLHPGVSTALTTLLGHSLGTLHPSWCPCACSPRLSACTSILCHSSPAPARLSSGPTSPALRSLHSPRFLQEFPWSP